jgi:hypothetical protein
MRNAPSSNAQLRFKDTRVYHLARVYTLRSVGSCRRGGRYSSERNDLMYWIKMMFMSGCTREPLLSMQLTCSSSLWTSRRYGLELGQGSIGMFIVNTGKKLRF